MASNLTNGKKLASPRPMPNGDGLAPAARSVPVRKKSSSNGLWIGLALALLLVAAGVYFFLHRGAAPATATAGAPASGGGGGSGGGHHHGGGAANISRVVVGQATKGDLGVYIWGLGTVTPLNTDTIVPRVNGQLMKVLYNEGQMVQEGDLLLQIDSRPYEAQLAQYNAQKERDQALLDNANIDLQRYQTLWKQDSIPQQTLATQISLVAQDKATVDNDQALIDATKLNIVYCNITAPISGRVGLRLVDPGNYVQSTGTTGLVVITQIQPITVIFTVPQGNIDPVLAKLAAGQTLTVEAYNSDKSAKLADGTLLTVDNQIDTTTGTLRFRALFPNTDNKLFPSQFVNARLLVDTKKDVVMVPVPAIQYGNQGTFVYVVDTDANTVKMTPVTVGTIDGDNAEIASGDVNEGDTVVTDGVDKLQDGSKIIISHAGEKGGGSGGGSGTPGADSTSGAAGSSSAPSSDASAPASTPAASGTPPSSSGTTAP
jgi:multidrug efflux system membrane fusion protein